MAESKLLVSIIIDNSSSMKGAKLTQLKNALQQFQDILHQANHLEYSLIAVEGLKAKRIKVFKDPQIGHLVEGGLALLNQTIHLSLTDLQERLNQLEKEGISYHKPWLIILTDGQSYETISDAVLKLKLLYQKGSISYFPFTLSNGKIDDRLDELMSLKKPIEILNSQYEHFFKWLLDTILKRLSTPRALSIKLDSNCFDGWTVK